MEEWNPIGDGGLGGGGPFEGDILKKTRTFWRWTFSNEKYHPWVANPTTPTTSPTHPAPPASLVNVLYAHRFLGG